jgi:hypothetical protein
MTSRKIAALAAALFLLTVGGAVALGPTGVLSNLAPTQFEGLAKVGPTDPQTHFPAWYRDRQGTALDACIDPADPNCLAPAGANFDPAKPLNLESPTAALNNFPDEFFYFNSTSVTKNAGVIPRMLVENNLEGAFANGPPVLGDQMVFARFRVKIDSGLKPSTQYKIVHPYGTADITTDAGATGIFVTRDVPIAPLDFKGALNTRLGPFLRWDPAVPPLAPDGYVGDPAIDHQVMNSPVGTNYVALLGPGVGQGVPAANQCPQGVLGKFNVAAGDCLYNDLFSLMGRKATRAGVDVTRATYTRGAGGTKLEVLAESNADQKIVAQDPDPTLRGTTNRRFDATLLPGANGQYFGHIPATALPDKVEVVNQSDAPATVKDVPLVDMISGTAVYDGANLHVVAKSSDQTAAAALSVVTDGAGVPVTDEASTITKALTGPGDGTGTGDFALAAPAAPPAFVIVRSSQGGSVELPVDVSTSPNTPPAPLAADAGPDKSIVNGALEPASVSLVGSGSTGNIATYAWTGPYAVGAGVVLAANADPTLGAAPVQSSPQDPNATIAPPTAVGSYGYRLTVTGPGGSASDDMVLAVSAGPTAAAEVITPGRQLYRDDQRRWVIDGTDSIIAGNAITVHNGPTTAGQVIGTSPIDTANNYVVDVRRSSIPPDPCLCVTLKSKLGNVMTLPVSRPKAPAAPAAPAPAAAAAVPGLPVLPVTPGAPVVAAARVAPVPTFAAAALVGAGVPLAVTVPARARVLRLRVLTVPGRARAASAATARARVLYRAFRVVPAARRSHLVRFRLRSRTLYARVRAGGRYVLEVTPGLSRARLGRPTRTTIRVR